jgi:hypothetical protein
LSKLVAYLKLFPDTGSFGVGEIFMSFDTLSPTSQTKLRVSELMIPVLL